MTFIPTQTGFMHLEDSEKLLRAIFPKSSQLGAVPFRAKSGTEKSWQSTANVRVQEETMGCATMDFTNLGDFAATGLVNVSGLRPRWHLAPQ